MKRLEIVVVVLIVGLLWFSGLHLIAAIVGVGSWAVLSYRDFQTKQLEQSNKATATHSGSTTIKPDDPEEPDFWLNATNAYLEKRSGWDYWKVFPRRKRLTHQDCYGGPPTQDEVYEYEVRGTSLFVRLIEKSEKGFDGRKYEVFNGSIVQAQLEEDYKKLVELYKDDSDETKSLMCSDTPTVLSAKLQTKLTWHEMHGAVRYFVLSKDATDGSNLLFFDEEYERLKDAFAAVADQAEKLGAVWDDLTGTYKPLEESDSETKEAIQQIRWDAGLLRFGIRRMDVRQQNLIMAVLGEATGRTTVRNFVKSKANEEQARERNASKSALVPAPSSALARTGSQAPARLGDLLVKEKVITSEQLEQATKFRKDTHTRLESALVKLGFLSDEDVTNFLSRQYGVPAINLSCLKIDPAVVKLISYETAKRHQILPLSRVGASLTIAMVDPNNVFTMDEIKFMTGFNIEPVVASGSSIIEGIDKAYGTSKDGTRKVERVDLADGEEGV
jgi:hypothetical protein